jgi:IS1 transposase
MGQHLPVQLTPEERQQLQGYTRRGVHHSRVIARAQMLLLADKNQPQSKTRAEIVQILDCSVERFFCTLRQRLAQWTRKSLMLGKSLEMHEAALAVFIDGHNESH